MNARTAHFSPMNVRFRHSVYMLTEVMQTKKEASDLSRQLHHPVSLQLLDMAIHNERQAALIAEQGWSEA